MVKQRELTTEERSNVQLLWSMGYNLSDISRQLKKPVSTIHYTIARIKTHKTVQNLPRVGRPRKTTTKTDSYIAKLVEKSESPNAVELCNELHRLNIASISPTTIRRRLHEKGIFGRARVKKPLLLSRHIKSRLEFAKKYRHWTINDWKHVLWTDETKICLHGNDGRRWTWRKRNERLKPKHIKNTIKHDKYVMVWGCFSSAGVGSICIIDGYLTADKYIEILNNHMLPSAKKLIGNKVILQQDNDPKHTANDTMKWFKKNKIEIMKWPSQSPDINPIENMWFRFKSEIRKKKFNNIQDLKQNIEEIWKSTPVSYCKALSDSMPTRIKQVIANKGKHTKY